MGARTGLLIVFLYRILSVSCLSAEVDDTKSTSRADLVAKYGGTKASEVAVDKALDWLAKHQLPDGGWCFDHRAAAECKGRCSGPGSASAARNAATAMALLPFLGADETHKKGNHKDVVKAGLAYLVGHQEAKLGGGSFHESGGSMYSHGLASIALCKAYALTNDQGMREPAQAAIKFIVAAQDPVGGGWRYTARSPGDTSVTGWQISALKIAELGMLDVPPKTLRGAMKFLDHVSADGGAFSGYTGPGRGQATTAIGLLCRMKLGWQKDNAALRRGVDYLDERGPSFGGGRANMYYNFYATQVMFQFGGDVWKGWNARMRDVLVDAQSKDGHSSGSWHLTGGHSPARGGRLYCTSLAALTLEIYYREPRMLDEPQPKK